MIIVAGGGEPLLLLLKFASRDQVFQLSSRLVVGVGRVNGSRPLENRTVEVNVIGGGGVALASDTGDRAMQI